MMISANSHFRVLNTPLICHSSVGQYCHDYALCTSRCHLYKMNKIIIHQRFLTFIYSSILTHPWVEVCGILRESICILENLWTCLPPSIEIVCGTLYFTRIYLYSCKSAGENLYENGFLDSS